MPGNVEVWKRVLRQKNYSDVTRDWGKRARTFNNSEQLLEALVAISRVDTEIGPLQAYLMLSELDAGRDARHRLAVLDVADGFSEPHRVFGPLLEQVEGNPLGGARPDSRQAGQLVH